VKLFLEPDGSPGQVHELTIKDQNLSKRDGFFYNENYFLIAITESGYYGYVNILVSNSGVTKYQPAISFTIVTPERERLVKDMDYDPDDLVMDDGGFDLKIKHNRFRETGSGYELDIKVGDMGMKLDYDNEVPGFVLGNGKAVFGADGEDWFYINYPAPRPKVTGHFLVNGEKVPVKGWGYADHSITVSDPTNFQKTWHNMKFHSDTHTVLISSFETPERFEKDFGHAVITDDEKVLCAFTDVRVTEHNIKVDPESEKPYPMKVTYELVGDGCDARAVVDTSNVTEKFDVLQKLEQKWYGKAVKAAINTFIAEPWYFRAVTPVTIEMDLPSGKTTVTGVAFNEIIYTE